VGPQLVKEAAKEAVRGVGFDILIICGFAFDPHVSEEAKRYGKLTILSARMNPDLAMGDELLKKTGAGNLFMVFGEPDVEVVSEEWLVDSSGKRIAPYELYKIVSGTDRLAEINGLGAGDLRRYAVLSQRREVWADLADAAGGGVDPRKHRGGSGEKHDRRVSAIARHVEGFAGGIGNVDDFVRELGFADQRKFRSFVEQLRGSKQVAQWADQIACHSPLTTRHFCRVTLRGLDVYDPTTGEIRSNSTDDIACWFIDTDYNGESFFVRHAYFTGADEPYEKLKNALRSEIDEAAWTALYSTRSRPFDKPETGKIAVKVINHYGDEVMKVFPA
jgi:adenine-specific DNA-methyltransferase